MRQLVHFTVQGTDYSTIREAAEAKLKLLLGPEATLPFDAEFDISESSEVHGDGQTLGVEWVAEVSIRATDASYQTT